MWTSFVLNCSMCRWVGPGGWKWLRRNKVRWTEGTRLAYRVCLLVQFWNVRVGLAGSIQRLGCGIGEACDLGDREG